MRNEDKTILMINVHEDDVLCFRKEVICALASVGYDVILLYPLGNRSEEIQSSKIRCVNIQMDRHGTNPLKDLRLLFSYIRVIKRFNPDIVLLYTIKPNIYGSLASVVRKVPYINNITGIGSTLQGRESLLQKLIKVLYKISLRNSEHVFFQNRDNFNLFIDQKLCKSDICSIIPGSGVDLQKFSYTERKSSDKIVFNFIGRIMKKKGIIEYIDAARAIKRDYCNCEFNILGFFEEDEPEQKKMVEDAESEGIVIYRGNVNDVRPFIINSDATILPSKYGEGVSNVLLETAAIGRVIITTDIPGCRDLVSNNNGFVFSPGDVEGLINSIKKFLSLSDVDRREMGRNARNLVEKSFSRDIVVKEYLEQVHKAFVQGEL